jgi:Domain of Unknown Function (DUF1080)
MAGEGTFLITDENALQSAGQGIFWYTKQKFENFVLELDWKVSNSNDNSGVLVRFSDPGNDPKIVVKSGYEIQIDDGAGNPTKMVSNPPGQWNSMKVEVVKINLIQFL